MVFGAVILVCFILLFGFSAITQGAVTSTASVGFSMSKETATRRHKGLVLNYVSKRRVPNGPDPIHNRYANTFIFIFMFIVHSALISYQLF